MNQSLLSVAPYTHYIWYLLLLLQGLFIAASFIPTLWTSELLGYNELAHTTEGKALQKLLPVMLYPGLCLATIITTYSFFNLKIMTLAFLGSSINTFLLVSIIKYQLDYVTTADTFTKVRKWFQRRRAPPTPDENTLNEYLNDNDMTIQIQQYLFLKLPFELYAGYNLAWNVSLLNLMIQKLTRSAILSELLAYISLLFLLAAGCYVMWTEKKGLCYGVGAGLAWYLLGVFFQLVYLSFPIMYAYSDAAISVTKYMTIIIANLLVCTMALRVAKNIINVRRDDDFEFCSCCGRV